MCYLRICGRCDVVLIVVNILDIAPCRAGRSDFPWLLDDAAILSRIFCVVSTYTHIRFILSSHSSLFTVRTHNVSFARDDDDEKSVLNRKENVPRRWHIYY